VTPEKKRLIPCKLCGSELFIPSLVCEGFSFVRCTSCGLVQMNPQPLEAEIRLRYDQRHGEDYLAYELANESKFLDLQLLAIEDAGFGGLERELLLGGRPRILDIGCAAGSLLARLRENGWETAGVEISRAQAEYSRQKRNLDVRSLPLEENHFPGVYFNVVHASHLIEHLNDPAGLIQEIHRILIPGGRLFVTTPNIAGFQARLFGSRWRSAIFDHLYLFSVKTLSRLLEEKGFAIEKIATWGGLAAGIAPAPVKRFFDRAAKRLSLGDVMMIRARREEPKSHCRLA
jgi:SAM-dependent methyltransferase